MFTVQLTAARKVAGEAFPLEIEDDFVATAPVAQNHPVLFPSQPQVRKLTTRAHIKGSQWEKQARIETALLININTIRHDELN